MRIFLPLMDAAKASAAVYMGPLQHKIQERTTRINCRLIGHSNHLDATCPRYTYAVTDLHTLPTCSV